MAWNRSNNKQTEKTYVREKNPRLVYGLIALALIIFCGLLCWLTFSSGEKSPASSNTQSSNKLIKVVKPSAAPTNKIEKVKTPFWKLDKSQTNGFTKSMQRKWEIEHRPRMPVPEREPNKPEKYEIFDFRSENMIAELLCSKPGDDFIGRPMYRGLTADFLKSCERPIIITANDSEYNAALKRQMNETKIELKSRIDAGEDLGDIIEEAREELRKVAEYKRMLEQEFRAKLKDTKSTPEDVEDFQKAVNEMLEKKGVAPMKLSPIAQRQISNLKGVK